MPLLQLFVLAAVQGITEFLPISSSGHLILVPKLTAWPDQGLVIDVAVHVGTLLAVVLYFMKDILAMIGAFFRRFHEITVRQEFESEYLLVLNLIIATIPIIIAGYLANRYLGDAFRSLEVIGWTTLGFAFLLFLADKLNMTIRGIDHITFRGAFIIGSFQILALIPGTSRSGVTMTMARTLGFARVEAARFSFLLGLPAILGSGLFELWELSHSGFGNHGTLPLLLGIGSAFVCGWVAIEFLLRFLRTHGTLVFVLYRLLLGSVILATLP